MAFKRTGNVQTERTATGIITTAEEKGRNRSGSKQTRWVQIGYTSVILKDDGKEYVDGLYGKRLDKAVENGR